MSLLPDIVVVFLLNGERRELNYRKLPFSAWSELKAQLAFTPMSVMYAVAQYDLEAIGALIWLERKQRERMLRWVDIRRELEHGEFSFKLIDGRMDGESIVGGGEEDRPPKPEEPLDPTPASS